MTNESPETTEFSSELQAVGMEEIPAEVLAALVATGREFYVTRSVTYSVGYMDVHDDEEPTDEKTA